jgi:peptide/nickel transport system substrate-binding protein
MYVDDNTEVPRANALELVQKNWAAVGVKLNLQPVDSTLYLTKRQSNDYDFDGTPVPTDDNWDLEPVYYVPIANNSHFAPAYGQWYSTKGQSGIEPPEEFKKMLNDLQSMRVATSAADRVSYGRSIMKQHDEQTYMIGLVSPPFSPVIVKDNVKNVRNDNPQLSYYYEYEAITKPEQVYFA